MTDWIQPARVRDLIIRDPDGGEWRPVKWVATRDVYQLQRVGFHSETREISGQELFDRYLR